MAGQSDSTPATNETTAEPMPTHSAAERYAHTSQPEPLSNPPRSLEELQAYRESLISGDDFAKSAMLHKGGQFITGWLKIIEEIQNRNGPPSEDEANVLKLFPADKMSEYYSRLADQVATMSEEMGIKPPPDIYFGLVNGIRTGLALHTPASVEQTSDGKNHLIISADDFLEAIKSEKNFDKLRTVLAHELTHIERHDGYAANVVDLYYDKNPTIRAIGREYVADLVGSGPLGVHNTDAMIAFNLPNTRNFQAYLGVFPHANISLDNLSYADFKAISDWNAPNDKEHASQQDRVDALIEEKRLMAEYEKSHNVVTHEDRVRESDYVVAQTMQYIADRDTLRAQNPAAAEAMMQVRWEQYIRETHLYPRYETQAPSAPETAPSSQSPHLIIIGDEQKRVMNDFKSLMSSAAPADVEKHYAPLPAAPSQSPTQQQVG